MKLKKKYLFYLIPILAVWGITFLSNLTLQTNIFGKYIYMDIDYRNQYYDALVFFRENYFSNPNYFTYYQGLGFGNEMLGFTNYYISSPLNFLLFLFPKNLIYVAIGFLSYLRLALGVISFRYLIKNFKVSEITKQVFTITYALSGFFISNTQNIIWMDMLFILPLYIKGIYSLVNYNKKYLFVFSTTYMVISNFYMGYMLCLLSLPLIIYFYLRKDKELNNKQIIIDYILSAIFIFLGSISTLYTSYIGTVSSKGIGTSNLFENPLQLKFTFTEFLSKFILGSNNSYEIVQGSPSVWLPTIFILIFILMFLDKNINKKTKILNLGLITTIYFLMSINVLNLILHGFSNPIWYPYRQSFIFTIIILLIVLEYLEKSNELSLFKGIRFWYIYYSLFNIILIYVFITKETSLFFVSNIITIIFLLIFNIVIYFYIKNIVMKKLFLYIPIIVTILLNSMLFNINNKALSVFVTNKDFKEYRRDLKNFGTYSIDGRGLYNTNMSTLEVINSDMFSYYSFSSTLNLNQSPLFDALGIPYNQAIIVNGYRTVLTDKLFSVDKLAVTNKEYTPFSITTNNWGDVPYIYNKVGSTESFDVFENTSLPIAYYSNYNKNYYESNYSDNNLFSQQQYINNLLGIDLNYFDFVKGFKSSEQLTNPIKDKKTNLNFYNYTSDKKNVTTTNGVYYLYSEDKNSYEFLSTINNVVPSNTLLNNINDKEYTRGVGYNYVNGFYLDNPFNYNIMYKDSKKQKINGKLEVSDFLYKLNMENIKELDKSIIKHSPKVENNKSGLVKVDIDKKQDFDLLRTTIPYSKYWKAYNNDKQVNINELDTFLSVNIKNLEGTIVFKYEVPYLKTLKFIQITMWLLLLVLCYIDYKKRRNTENEK